MILQALTRYYEDLLSRGEIAAPGWAPAKISLALYISELTQIVPTMDEVSKGKKTVLQPQSKPLPAPVKRASNIASNFLWDNSSYLLGIDQKGKPERSRECFAAAAKLHHAVLDGIDSPNARAILAFFDTWEPDRAAEHPALIRQLDDVTAGGNLVFRVDGRKVEEDAAIREAWQRYRDGGESGVKMQCLVTGKEDEIAAVHPSVKGVRDAQSSGAALVSFNAPAFCSYGREQNYNAPVGKYAAFAYTAALNHLLADSDHVQHIGDTTVVCWAEGADDAYPGFFSAVIGGGTYGGLSDNDLRAALKRLANGLPCDDLGVDPNRPFYILGLAPNAARLSVRFFLRDSFGKLMENVNAHYARLEIAGAKYSILPLWALLNATVRDPKKQVPSPVVSGATVRAVFSGTPYPVSLMEAVLLRIRAERNVTWERAAILKAYLAKNYERGSDHSMFSEVTSVQLNEDCNYMPYLLGRLFRVMEEIQLASMGWSVNRSIRDSYFNSAASTPRSVFGKLFSLSNYHLKKLMRDKPGLGKKLGDLESDLAAFILVTIISVMAKRRRKKMSDPIKNRYEFVVLFDVENGNPNGDPDAGNMPRVDPETGYGLVTDVCLKRKIRNYVEMAKEGEKGYRIYIKDGVPLNSSDKEACAYVGADPDKLKEAKKKDEHLDEKIRDFMCSNFYDIRTFGAVMTTFTKGTLNCGQVRGPVQLGFARSIDPILPQEVTITRVAITTEADAEKKNTEMGRKYIVPYGLYRAEGYVSANLARKTTGFSEEDLELLWTAILNMFENDHSAARGKMAVRELIVFKHNCELGCAPAHKLFDLVKVEHKDGVTAPRSYGDYTVSVDETHLPSGVTCTRMG
jgi:CRISPR-associated protein Cas8c/Csd1 subtype I-C